MTLNSLKFVVFAFIVLIVYYIVPKKYRWIFLLVSSYVFYYLACKKLIVYIVLSSISIYIGGILLQKQNKKISNDKKRLQRNKKIIMLGTLLFNVIVLLVLKYSNFFIISFNNLFRTNFSLFRIVLPLGISYWTLEAISYIVDVYRGKINACSNFFKLNLFLMFFPKITEGPISRYDDLMSKLTEGHSLKYENVINGASLMLWGYFKKMVIADRCAIYVNNMVGVSGIAVLIGIILWTIQIYFEFSGCMDIVQGFSNTLGIKLSDNFKRPFFSKSIQEFWRRWHITLGTWLKEYVFYPISLSKISMKITKFSRKKFNKNLSKFISIAFSLFFVWFLNGFWHGASWKYIFYGLYYYIIMMIGLLFKPLTDKLISKFGIKIESKKYKFFQIIRTIIFVCIGMHIFRSASLKDSFIEFISIFSKSNNSILNNGLSIIDFTIIIVGVIIMFVYGLFEEKGYNVINKINNSPLYIRYCVYLIIVFSIIIFGIWGPGYNASDFIYGQF